MCQLNDITVNLDYQFRCLELMTIAFVTYLAVMGAFFNFHEQWRDDPDIGWIRLFSIGIAIAVVSLVIDQ